MRRPFRLSSLTVLALAALLVASSGCADILRAAMKPSQQAKQQEAEAQKKAEKEAAEAAKKKEQEEKQAAAQKELDDALASKDLDKLKALNTKGYSDAQVKQVQDAIIAARLEKLIAAPCDKAVEAFEAVRSGGPRAADEQVFFAGWEKLGTCKQWGTLFTTYLHYGDGPRALGKLALQETDKRGLPVDKEFVAFMKGASKNPFPQFPLQAMANFAEFRVAKTDGGLPCKDYVPMASKVTGDGLFALLFLYGKLDCKEAAEATVAALADDSPRTRERACWVLAEIGSKKHIAKMKIVAEKDATYKMKGAVPVYWVRDSCQQAIGKLELKGG